jgi:hypothetical protein
MISFGANPRAATGHERNESAGALPRRVDEVLYEAVPREQSMRRTMVRRERARSVTRGAFVVLLAVATSAWQESSKQQRREQQSQQQARQPTKQQSPQQSQRQGERERAAHRESAAPGARLPDDLRATARAMADQQYRHRQRLARIERLRQVYRGRNDLAKVAQLDELRTKENARYSRYLDERRRELGPERYAQVERALANGAPAKVSSQNASPREQPAANGRGGARGGDVR